MPDAQRTLVKSPPELWAEISDPDALGRHLGELGDIRIVRREPETTVAWEGDRVRGTVELEPAGWGTKVTLTAEVHEPEPEPQPVADAPPQRMAPQPAPAPPPKRSWLDRLLRRPAPQAPAEPQLPEPVAAAEPPPAPVLAPPDPEPVLVSALDTLGAAHHRPFSRG
ncbi:MAG TPA: hypothetical protein VD931_11330 [Baekduia sp.]|nr:hypothetical protein [Baekduia sp.]